MNPIEEAFWTLNSACATKIQHKDFLIMELENIKSRLVTETEGGKPGWYYKRSQWPARNKRAVGIITMIAIAITTAFAAAVPITLAVENNNHRKQIAAIHSTMDLHKEALTYIEETIEPLDFLTAASTNANHRISNGVLLSDSVIERLEAFTAHKNGKRSTSEKNTARSISTAMKYYYQNHSKPISDDPDMEYAMHRQMCTVVTRAESSRKKQTIRSTCPEVSIIETVVCAVPYLRPDNNKHILPHPHLESTYIDTYGDEFTMHGWLIHSNPHHSFQPIGQPPMDGYIIENMGRKIFTRTGVSVSFLHTKQVLADRIIIHTPEQSDLL